MTAGDAPREDSETEHSERSDDRHTGGAAVSARALDQWVDGTETTRLGDLCQPDEQPQFLLSGTLLDRVTGSDDSAERTRKMAAPGSQVLTLVTDRRVHLVVGYRDRYDARWRSHADLEAASLQEAAGEKRLQLVFADEQYDVYPRESTATVAAAVAYLDGRDSSASAVSELERLATLYEKGLLTDAEFTAAKRDLIDP